MTRLVLLLALAPLLAAAPAGRAEEVPPAQPTAEPAPAAPPKAKLAAWRAGARPPAEVPATAIVRAARKDRDERADADDRRRPAPSIEITWHAPGS